MLGKLHIASYSLGIGAIGQYWFYGRLFPNVRAGIVWGVLLLPWLAAFILTFYRQAPFGPRPFRRCLLVIICWYAFVTVLAEAIHLFRPLPPDGHFSLTAARVLMYIGSISFIAFVRAYIFLRRQERDQNVPVSSRHSSSAL